MSDDDGDDKVKRLEALPFRRPPGKPTPEKGAALPAAGDPYQAAGTAENNEVSRLVLVMGRDGFKPDGVAYDCLQYVHMGRGTFGFTANGEQRYRFLLGDLEPKVITLHGRNIRRICDYIGLRRMPWIRLAEADRDFRAADDVANDEPIITRITVEDWKPPEG